VLFRSSLLKLSILQGSLPPDLSKSFKQARSTISLATKEIRNISHRLAPASFSESTLKESLSLLLKTYNAGKKYNISLDYDPRIDTYPFSHSIKLNLYRIIQEQLSGIIKHSVASHIILSLYIEGTMLKLRIADNACCCEIQEMQNSIIFANMKRRVQLFSGSIELVSIPDEGHHIRIEIPVQKCLAETVASAAAVHN
jgi:signal transduction histidine kinase